MKVRWPPAPIGLGTPLNLAMLSSETRAKLARSWWWAPVLGLAIALSMMASDVIFFGGVTMRSTPHLNEHPPVGSRVLVALIGSLGEEIVFRVGVATLAAWMGYLILRHLMANPRLAAYLIGAVAGTTGSVLMHVGQNSHTELWRIVTINVVGNTVYGVLYFRRGLELAWLTHVIVTSILYIGVPALR